MKIYSKKTFVFGLSAVSLGLVNAILAWKTGFDLSGGILVACLLAFGGSAVFRSVSRKLSQADRLEELDERNQLIALKSKSRAFQLTQAVSFLLMLGLVVGGAASGERTLVGAGVCLALAWTVSMLAEVGAFCYFEDRD